MHKKPEKWIEPEEQRRERIDATVGDVIAEFGGRFELLSKSAHTWEISMDLVYDVRDVLGGAEFSIIADTLLAMDRAALAADIRRQLRARSREIA